MKINQTPLRAGNKRSSFCDEFADTKVQMGTNMFKNKKCFLFFSIIFLSLFLFNLSTIATSKASESENQHTVTYMSQGEVFQTQKIQHEAFLTPLEAEPQAPQDKVFSGWCLDEQGYSPWDYDDPVLFDIVLYANWGVGFEFYERQERPVIYNDVSKYNSNRDNVVINLLKQQVRAEFFGDEVELTISEFGTFVKNATTKEYPIGEHTITFKAESNGKSREHDYTFTVQDGAEAKTYVEVKENFGGAYGYFGTTKVIGFNADHVFTLNDDTVFTDYSITNKFITDEKGLPKELLDKKLSNRLKRFTDPILIHNNSQFDINFRPEDAEATYVEIDENGMVTAGFEGTGRTLIDKDHINMDTSRLTQATNVYCADRVLPKGSFLIVFSQNLDGNYFVRVGDPGQPTPNDYGLYDYDGRKFLRSNVIYRYGNMTKIYHGNSIKTQLTNDYQNQKPYVLKGDLAIEIPQNDVLTDADALKDVEFWDDNGSFVKDTKVSNDRISVDLSGVDFSKKGEYHIIYTVQDNTNNPEMEYKFNRLIRVVDLENSVHSRYVGENAGGTFVHQTVNFNVRYNIYQGGASYNVFVWDKNLSSGAFFDSFTSGVQWCSMMVVRKDGTILYGVGSDGKVYANVTETGKSKNSGTIPFSGSNMAINFMAHILGKTVSTTSQADISAYLDSENACLVVYPNTDGGTYARNFGNEAVKAFSTDDNVKLLVSDAKADGLRIGY